MADFMVSPFDKLPAKADPMPALELPPLTGSVALPASGWTAMFRGLRGHCPRCAEARLFLRFLEPMPHCASCGQDWTHQQADDFPAYISIFVTGHLMAPLIITLIRDAQLPMTALLTIILPLALMFMIGLLQPAKGAVIALEWWFGLHGFKKERSGAAVREAEAERPISDLLHTDQID